MTLTAAGRRAARRAAAARSHVLARSLTELTDTDRQTLDRLLAKVMTGVVNAKHGGAWICRLCDLGACERDSGHCPALNAALARQRPTT